jgi:DNA modification methylase
MSKVSKKSIKYPAHKSDAAALRETSNGYSAKLDIGFTRTCACRPTNINCLTAKDWMKSQVGLWEFFYEKRDVRDKSLHPATFPISMAKKVVTLFTHEGELVLDPFVGSGTTLIAAQDTNRNAVGFDLQERYIDLCRSRLSANNLFNNAKQIAICDDARNISQYLEPNSLSLIWTSPPYANLLNRARKNKSMRDRKNHQLGKIEQYSQDERDLGTKSIDDYTKAIGEIFEGLLPLLKPKGHCVINVPDFWWENKRITIHISVVEEMRRRGYELRNTIIWDRRDLVNNMGIFGWPSNYITMGTTFEYILDFWRPPTTEIIECKPTQNSNSLNGYEKSSETAGCVVHDRAMSVESATHSKTSSASKKITYRSQTQTSGN